MTKSSVLQKEIDVVIHGQTPQFRKKKYIVIVSILLFVYLFYGWNAVVSTLFVMAVLGICLHFLFRWKTNGWTKDWGRLKLPHHIRKKYISR